MTTTVLHLDTYRDSGWIDPSAGGWAEPLVKALRNGPSEDLVSQALLKGLYVAVARTEAPAEGARIMTQNPAGGMTPWSKQRRPSLTVLGDGYFSVDPGNEEAPELGYRASWNGDLIVEDGKVDMVLMDKLVPLSLAVDLDNVPEIDPAADAALPTP